MQEGFSIEKSISLKEQLILDMLGNISDSFGLEFSNKAKLLLSKIKNKDLSSIYAKLNIEDISKNIDDIFIIENAIKNKNLIGFSYQNKNLEIEPYRIMNFDGFWYLIGNDPKANFIKKFHFKSIKNIKVLDKKFKKIKELDEYLNNAINVWFDQDQEPYEVILEISREVSKYFERKKISKTQILIDKNSDFITISIHVTHEMEIIPIILEWIPHIKVVSPIFLKNEIKKKVSDYLGLI